MNCKDIGHRLQNRWIKLRLAPIPVYCFHQVSKEYNPLTMWEEDWTQIEQFKKNILSLKSGGVDFISLPEAYEKLNKDLFRCKKYAVLTADDGNSSINNILPWLNEQHIPITLFINPAYQDGKHFRERETEEYLTATDLSDFAKKYPLVTIGSHGWEHKDALQQTIEEFKESITHSNEYLKNLPNYIPYYAYTWGHHTRETDKTLKDVGMIPVFVEGGKNYIYNEYIDRIAIDGKNESDF